MNVRIKAWQDLVLNENEKPSDASGLCLLRNYQFCGSFLVQMKRGNKEMEQIILRQVRFVQNSNEAGLIIIIIMTRVEGICIEEHSQRDDAKRVCFVQGSIL